MRICNPSQCRLIFSFINNYCTALPSLQRSWSLPKSLHCATHHIIALRNVTHKGMDKSPWSRITPVSCHAAAILPQHDQLVWGLTGNSWATCSRIHFVFFLFPRFPSAIIWWVVQCKDLGRLHGCWGEGRTVQWVSVKGNMSWRWEGQDILI